MQLLSCVLTIHISYVCFSSLRVLLFVHFVPLLFLEVRHWYTLGIACMGVEIYDPIG